MNAEQSDRELLQKEREERERANNHELIERTFM
jgi:hypothetical protein